MAAEDEANYLWKSRKWHLGQLIVHARRTSTRGLARRSGFPLLQKIKDQFDAGRNAQFIVGSDGVLAGIAAIIAVTFLLQFHGSHFAFGTQTGWAVAGSCLGFLFFNFPPATIFMGDSGSTVLGFVAAFLALDLYRAQESAPLAGAVAFLPAALPLTDAALAILRRVRGNISLVKGDRLHFYDLLLARGWPARRVALACYGITGLFCLAGWLATKFTYAWGTALSVITVAGFLILEWRLGALQIPKPDNSMPDATVLRLPNLFENPK